MIDGELMDTKECTQCNQVKPLINFGICNKSTGGRQPKCKDCRRNYYNANKKHIIQKSKKNYYEKHEDNKLKRKVYYKDNRVEIREKQKKKYFLNRDKITTARKIEYLQNRERILEQHRLYRLRNLEKIREYDRNRYLLRKEERASYHKKYYDKNRLKFRLYAKKRKKYVRFLPFTLIPKEWSEIEKHFQGLCALSENDLDLNMEHFIPVVWGHGGTYIGNVYPLYWSINRSKSDTNPFVWIERTKVKSTIDTHKWNELILYLASQNKLTVDEFKDFVFWCETNKRSVEEIVIDERPSIDIWKSHINN